MIEHQIVFSDMDIEIHKITSEIPIKALRSVNCYIIKSRGEALLIDTGMGNIGLREYIEGGIGSIDVVFATHFHIDHLGGAPQFLGKGIEFYMSRSDIGDVLALRRDPIKYINYIKDIHLSNGVPRELVDEMFRKHPGWWRLVYCEGLEDIVGLDDGDIISVGSVDVKVILTPGHTPGHACIFIEDYGILFTGDHILEDITPNIPLIRWGMDPLGDYLANLDKIREINASIGYPAHRGIIRDVNKRISELKTHHRDRLNEVISLLRDGDKTAYQLASLMKWDVKYDSWPDFPASQKYFAVAEALSHIKYLLERGILGRYEVNGVYYYHINE